MKAKELRERSDTELRNELTELEQGLFNLRMQGRTAQNARYAQFKSIRRDIARIKTVQNERHAQGEADENPDNTPGNE